MVVVSPPFISRMSSSRTKTACWEPPHALPHLRAHSLSPLSPLNFLTIGKSYKCLFVAGLLFQFSILPCWILSGCIHCFKLLNMYIALFVHPFSH